MIAFATPEAEALSIVQSEKEEKPQTKAEKKAEAEAKAAEAVAPAAEKPAPSKALERSSAVPRPVCNRLASRFDGPPISLYHQPAPVVAPKAQPAPSWPRVLQLSGLQARHGLSLRLGRRSFSAHVFRPRGGGC